MGGVAWTLPERVTVWVRAYVKTYGESDPTFTLEFTGATGEIDQSSMSAQRDPGENAGTYTINVSGPAEDAAHNYRFTYENGKLTIDPASITLATATQSQTGFTYNGQVQKPTISLVDNRPNVKKNLVEGTDYSLTFSNASSTNPGSYTATVTGKGNYQGSTSFKYTIAPAQTSDPTSGNSGNGNSGNGAANAGSQTSPGNSAGSASSAGSATISNPIKVKAKKITLSPYDLWFAKQKVKKAKAFTVKKNKGGKVTFKKKSGDKQITIAKNGNVTVKKGTLPGVHKVKVAVTSAAKGAYKKTTKTVTLKVKVKNW